MAPRPWSKGHAPGRGRKESMPQPLVRDAVRPLLKGTRVSPGTYYERMLPLWERDGRRGWTLTKKNKAEAIRPLEEASKGRDRCAPWWDSGLIAALHHRQHAALEALCAGGQAFSLELESLAPLTTGLGRAHPLEVGFAFLKPYGVPYLAGSGLKGAVRAACRSELWGLGPKERHPLDDRIFGGLDPKKDPRRGAAMFLDVFPGAAARAGGFRVDLVNPHFGPYYQETDVPAEWHNPVPVPFLTLAPGVRWCARVVLDTTGLDEKTVAGSVDALVRGLALGLLRRGVGAKKSWGYGLFALKGVRVFGGDGQDAAEALASRVKAVFSELDPWPPVKARTAAGDGRGGGARPVTSSSGGKAPREVYRFEIKDHELVKRAAACNRAELPKLYGDIARHEDAAVKELALATLTESVAKNRKFRRWVRQNAERFPLVAQKLEEMS